MCLEIATEKNNRPSHTRGKMYLFPKNEILLAKVLISIYAHGMSPIEDTTESKNNSLMPPANVSVPTVCPLAG